MIPTLDDAVVVALDTRASNMRGSPGFLSARSYLEHLRFEVEDIVVVVGRGDALHFFQRNGRNGGRIDDARVFVQERARGGAWSVVHEVALIGLLLERCDASPPCRPAFAPCPTPAQRPPNTCPTT